MGKKKRNRDTSKLRAQVEFLKAQLKTGPAASPRLEETPPRPTEPDSSPVKAQGADAYQLNPTLLRHDLRKTFLLTFLASLLLAAAYFTQNYWLALNVAASAVLKGG